MTAKMAQVRANAGPAARLVGVIGSPIAHSLSPVLHNAAFEALGLGEWHSHAFEVPAGHAADALEGVRASGMVGISVTMPHKGDVAALVDECSSVAQRLDAVNCVVNRDGTLFGANTDGEGLISSLRRGVEFEPAGRRCLVIGAGGAARAVVLALAESGAAQVGVMNRTGARAEAAASLAGAVGRVVEGNDVETVAQADLVVNATPVGMLESGAGSDDWLVSPKWLHAGQVVADLIYVPRVTEWLGACERQGARTIGGLGMLVHQAAAQIALWTGEVAPVDAMWSAASVA